MSDFVIWHNPRCRKSREGLAFLTDRGIEPEIVRYKEDPPDAETLARVLAAAGLAPRDLLRTREKAYKELGLRDRSLSDEALIEAMVTRPELIERPVVIRGDRAILGRPAEAIAALLD